VGWHDGGVAVRPVDFSALRGVLPDATDAQLDALVVELSRQSRELTDYLNAGGGGLGLLARIDEIDGEVGNLAAQLGGVSGDVTSLAAQLSASVKTLNKTISDAVDGLDGKIGNVDKNLLEAIDALDGKVGNLDEQLAAVGGDLGVLAARVRTVQGDVTVLETTAGTVRRDVGLLSERVGEITATLADIEQSVVLETLMVGAVESVSASEVVVRVSTSRTVTATEWYVPVTPLVGEKVLVGRTGSSTWALVSTFRVDPPRVLVGSASVSVLAPVNPAVERWQVRWRREGGVWSEEPAVAAGGAATDSVSGLSAGLHDVQIRYDLVGETGWGEWSASTSVTVPVSQLAAPTVTVGSGPTLVVQRPPAVTSGRWQVRWRLAGSGWVEIMPHSSSGGSSAFSVVPGSYEVQVRWDPAGALGWSAWSASASVVATGKPIPAAPLVLPAAGRFTVSRPAAAESGAVLASWAARWRAAASSGDWAASGDLAASKATHAVSGLAAGSWDVAVSYKAKAGTGSDSAVSPSTRVAVPAAAAPAPAAPTLYGGAGHFIIDRPAGVPDGGKWGVQFRESGQELWGSLGPVNAAQASLRVGVGSFHEQDWDARVRVEPAGGTPSPWSPPATTTSYGVGFGLSRTTSQQTHWFPKPGQRVDLSPPRRYVGTVTVSALTVNASQYLPLVRWRVKAGAPYTPRTSPWLNPGATWNSAVTNDALVPAFVDVEIEGSYTNRPRLGTVRVFAS